MSDGEREWLKGYEAGRAACLARGVDVARQRRRRANAAFESGYDWALWDHEDANGLPHESRQGA
jgi:hypothetical protein